MIIRVSYLYPYSSTPIYYYWQIGTGWLRPDEVTNSDLEVSLGTWVTLVELAGLSRDQSIHYKEDIASMDNVLGRMLK